MKHPDRNVETFEFNLGKAPDLRCVQQDKTSFCGTCESCCLTAHVTTVKAWFLRAGDQSQRRFVLGLIRRLHSVDLIQYVINILQPLMCKDFMYARTRTTPSLQTDRATMSCDRALSPVELEKNIAEAWFWFQQANYWTKTNFMLSILQCCDTHLLHTLGTHAKTLLASEQKAFVPKDDYESSSVTSSSYSFHSESRPELDLLSTVGSCYSPIKEDPFAPSTNPSPQSNLSKKTSFKVDPDYDVEIINDDDSDDESFTGGCSGDVDPTCLVVPGSAKAYAGVAQHRDFIRRLPVHLSKYILSFLDRASLSNCVCVSKHWRLTAEEVHKEFYVNQQVREEVMLMQGASAQGCNPVYANDVDVTVPNIAVGSWEAIKTGEDVIATTFKSEVSFETAYSGYSTRKIIMEERNVYCGAYNVMVLTDESDASRVIDTDGGELIALGCQDRKVRFINTTTGQEQPPTASGHAGSVRCVALCEGRGLVLSGSYDTSIRKWSLASGKCESIFRGHRDTILCLRIHNDKVVSGSKDRMCKVWLLDTAKCVRTFKHRHPVTAVALGEDPLPEMVVSGCEGGRVKVWALSTGTIVKRLSGHHSPVTDIKFDAWHIVTSSRDGYALVWSAQGDHSRCLTALRHPKEVLCLEFMYLRVITGSADGKLRIWNILNGQCLRIMRGNSRSDPILHLRAINNRITINTTNNLLILNFEAVDYDYTLDDDKMPPLVQYSKYSDAPIRSQPYPYVRAQRMRTAGATNQKIVYHSKDPQKKFYQNLKRPDQTPHSAKSLSKGSMDQALRIQSAAGRLERARTPATDKQEAGGQSRSAAASRASFSSKAEGLKKSVSAHSMKSVSISNNKPRGGKANRPVSTKSGSASVVSAVGFQIGKKADTDSDVSEPDNTDFRRRVSWAFEHPVLTKGRPVSLFETKHMLKSQMRAKGEVVPPDFIYLTVNSIHTNMKPTEASKNMEMNRREQELHRAKIQGRPSSSPSRVDPRTKVPIEDLQLEYLLMEHGLAPKDLDVKSEAESRVSFGSRTSKVKSNPDDIPEPTTTVIVTEFTSDPIETKPGLSLHSSKVKSSIPKARVLRPHTATVIRGHGPGKADAGERLRPKSAAATKARPGTAQSAKTAASDGNRSAGGTSATVMTSSGTASGFTPMVMYSRDMKEKFDAVRDHRASQKAEAREAAVRGRVGNVSRFNDPMRNHADFRLHTYEQAEEHRSRVLDSFQQGDRLRAEQLEKKQRQAWLNKVRGTDCGDRAGKMESVR